MSDSTLLHKLIIWFLNTLALMLTAHLIKGIHIRSFLSALMGALVISVANHLLLPVLTFLTLPLSFLTLGIFWFFLFGGMLKLSAAIIPGFEIRGWIPAIFGAIILVVIQWIFYSAFSNFAYVPMKHLL